MAHTGFAFIDVISPCVAFNNHRVDQELPSFVRDHLEATGTFDFVPMKEEITAHYAPGQSHDVTLHDGSVVRLHKADAECDISDRMGALQAIHEAAADNRILTGLLHLDAQSQNLNATLNLARKPLNSLCENELCPGSRVLKSINEALR